MNMLLPSVIKGPDGTTVPINHCRPVAGMVKDIHKLWALFPKQTQHLTLLNT